MGTREFMVSPDMGSKIDKLGLFIAIREIFLIQIDSIQIDISRKTDFRTPTKKAIIPSDGVEEVPSPFSDRSNT